MESSSVEIVLTRISKININIAKKAFKNLQLKVKWKIEFLRPDNDDNSVLLNAELDVFSEGNEYLSIELGADIIFEFDEKNDDYEDFYRKACLPLAQKTISKKLDSILETAGYPKLNLISHMN